MSNISTVLTDDVGNELHLKKTEESGLEVKIRNGNNVGEISLNQNEATEFKQGLETATYALIRGNEILTLSQEITVLNGEETESIYFLNLYILNSSLTSYKLGPSIQDEAAVVADVLAQD